MQLERAQLFRRRGIGGTAEEDREPLDGTDILALRIGYELRMFMSSSMRWRSGLMGFSLIGGSCLEVGVLNPSILKTERPPVTCARSNDYCGRSNAPDRAAVPSRGSGFVVCSACSIAWE